jgi:serine/threonine-protein kinase
MSLVGKSIGRYRILEQLGQGGMAVVYKAYDTRLERDVALKVIRTGQIPPDHLNKLLQRFEREAKSQAKFDHLYIVPVHDYGEHEGSPYIVMAYRPGGTLKQMTGKQIPYQLAAQFLAPIASALTYAHERNVLHRDVKPSNILISDKGVPAITDFGIAKLLEAEGTALTGTGMGIGTPEYMAPEQWRGEPVPQTDIYALGVVFYELVTGRKPYTADTPTAIALMQAMEPLPRPSELVPDLPERVEKVLFKVLSLKPEDRYGSMAEFGLVLEELAEGTKVEPLAEKPITVGVQTAPEPTPAEQYVPMHKEETSDDLLDLPISMQKQKKMPWFWVGSGVLVVVIVIGIVIGLAVFGDELTTLVPIDMPAPTIEPIIKIREKDNAEIAYIPAGAFEMGSEDGDPDEGPVHSVYLDEYWIDRYEVTNIQFAEFLSEIDNQEEGGTTGVEEWDSDSRIHLDGETWVVESGYEYYPVTEVNWYVAEAYCEWAGGRLPTEAEWEKAARGTLVGQLYPWGNSLPACTLGVVVGAQYVECGEHAVEVGSFKPNGYGLYDMAGNVWEWVTDWYDSNYYTISPDENPRGPTDGISRVLRGGSWFNFQNNLRVSYRLDHYPDVTLEFIGFRCANSEEPSAILYEKPELTTTSPPPEEVDTKVREQDGMKMSYISAGEFKMGSEYGEDDESPVHTVYLDAYWIDKYEVTNAQYALCVQAGGCDVSSCSYYENTEYADHPVVCVSWQDAQAYAEWVGGRLPTEAEWEKAARGGLEGHLFPWGNEDPSCTFGAESGAQLWDCGYHTVEVGSFAPNGYGLFDMAGNVWEWVADWYDSDYYSTSPAENPLGPPSGSGRVVRGGSFDRFRYYARCALRLRLSPSLGFDTLGFRIVVSP